MKKLLLSLSFVALSFSLNAQVLQSENFNTLTIGNVATDITGTTAGQGSYYVFSGNGNAPTTTTNASANNAAIVNTGGSNANTLSLIGPNGDKGSTVMWKDGLPAAWTARTSGNNIFEVEFDINPGGTSTSSNRFGVYIYNSDFTKILAGVIVRSSTKELSLVAYSTPTGQPTGNYTYSLAAAPGIQIPASQFSRVGVSYNKTTGQVTIKGPGIAAAGLSLQGAIGEDPTEVDFLTFSGSTATVPNTSSATMNIDNFIARAAATDSLLGNEEFATISEEVISVYPNPSKDVINVNSSINSFNSISIVDLNGRVVKNVNFDAVTEAQINISDLASGVYVMNVTSEKEIFSKKIVKE